MKYTYILLLIGLVLHSCAPTIHYLGKQYEPTMSVEVFFDSQDIKREYSVMGKMQNQGGEFEMDDTESVQKAMIEKAKSVGADAIIFEGLYQEKVIGESSQTRNNPNRDVSNSDSIIKTTKVYRVTLIKYK